MSILSPSTPDRKISVNSETNSPLLRLEKNPLEAVNLRYPLNLGQDQVYKHLMRIAIYKQNASEFSGSASGSVISNRFDISQKAGKSKVKTIEGAKAGSIALAGIKGGQALLSGGGGVIQKFAQPLGQGAAGLASGVALQNDSIDRKTSKIPSAYVALYMPDSIIFTDKHDFDSVSITDALGTVGTVAGTLFDGAETGELLGRTAELSGQFGRDIVDVALFTKGYALNPQLEILYKKTNNREFVYQFRFAPRNPKEADELNNILRTLRYHASPEYSRTDYRSRYFVPPSEFEIEFFVGSKLNQNIPRIGQCVLTNVDVNYTPNSRYSVFYDGMPVEVQVQLTFTETIILTKEDVKIGY